MGTGLEKCICLYSHAASRGRTELLYESHLLLNHVDAFLFLETLFRSLRFKKNVCVAEKPNSCEIGKDRSVEGYWNRLCEGQTGKVF